MRAREAAVSAVSEPEKKAEHRSRNAIARKMRRMGIGALIT
jgi:hypothetical protein